jgi:pyruvate/2-oxoglutarate dehydrogenase complex dihydrolipoamide acyltransferase (E2) component
MMWQMPPIGDGVDSVIIEGWRAEIGETIIAGDTLLVVESDKATVDLESPVTGTLVVVLAEEGDEVRIGQPLAELERA